MAGNTEKRQNRFSSGLIILGLLCIFGAAVITAYNYWDAARAEKASREVLEKLEKVLNDTEPDTEKMPDGNGQAASADTVFREMYTVEIDGFLYIGVLEIPSLSLSLPVMQQWDYERLKISPCRYSGSYYTDDLVICGHNYARHFSPVKNISMGADIWLITADGDKIHYIADNIQTVRPAQIEEMVSNDKNSMNSSSWDLTLFTCNTGGMTRCAVRCVRVDD